MQWSRITCPVRMLRAQHLFLDQMRHFLAVIRGRGSPRCTLEDGRKALRLALAVHLAVPRGASDR